MRKKEILALVVLFFSTTGLAAHLELNPGESVTLTPNSTTTVSCAGSDGTTQTATTKTCRKEDPWGNCIYFNETTLTGKYCETGKQCGKQNPHGDCIYFNKIGACGEKGCTLEKKCGQEDPWGNCKFFNSTATCH